MTEAGNYWGTLKGGQTGVAQSGNPKVTLTFTVTHVAAGQEWESIRDPFGCYVDIALTDNAWPYSQKKLESLGFNGDFGDGMAFTETGAKLVCKHDNYEGRIREKWELDGGFGERQQADANTVRKLNALWKAKNGTPKPPAGKPKAPPAAAAPESDETPRVDENGIPF